MNTIIVLSAKYLFLISFVVTGIFFLSLSSKDRIKMLFVGILSGVISLILLKISSVFINDPRPFVINHVIPLIPHAPDNGFPSDHTLITMWLALVVFLNNRRIGIALIVISLVVGISRVMALIHHPIDIIGSIVIATVSVWASNIAITKLVKNAKESL